MNKKVISKTKFVENEEIKNITTFKTQGYIKGAYYPKNESQLKNIYQFLKRQKAPFIIVGNGSNLLIENNPNLLVISTKNMEHKIRIKEGHLFVSASVPLFKVFEFCASHGYGGFESIACIPATIGGAIKNNASCFGQSIFDNLESINVCVGNKTIELKKDDIVKDHHSTNLNDILIISAKFALKRKKICEIKQNFANYLSKKQIYQPQGCGCGCVFKNPTLYSAGKLIEDCGLKNTCLGDAIISPKHANFILNTGAATYEDVKKLIELAKNCVHKKFGITLECEVQIIEKI